ncbi:hypothetical protein DSO57_1009954 [Entomophthora muscae]|uniref:Uncharacterized protein n=1 Tax=Entomophthora muscae TaxID=34485 RepID=A0ACC2UGR8_9FUNG|nr:hypothetical protein DSO57_1009954 [Entomophthora muscae]
MDLEVKEVDFEAADDGRVVYSKLKRYLVLGLVSIAGLLGPISSTIYVWFTWFSIDILVSLRQQCDYRPENDQLQVRLDHWGVYDYIGHHGIKVINVS